MTVGHTPPPTRATVDGRAYLDLRAMAKKSGRANDEYLRLYALEGFLLRLASSASSQDFILKGGVLLAAYQLRRPTADIDFAALKTPNDVETIKSMIIAVADTQLPDDQNDGLWFDTSDTHGVTIRDEDEYNGVRITLGAQLSTAKNAIPRRCQCWRPDLAQPSDGAVSPPFGWTHHAARLSDPDGVGREDRDRISAWHHKHTMARLRRPLPDRRSTSPCRRRRPLCDQRGGRLSKRRNGLPSPCARRLPRLSASEVARLARTAEP